MNMKNVMVALAAAMLVPALAPTAAADVTCNVTTPTMDNLNGQSLVYQASGSFLGAGEREYLIPSLLAQEEYTVQRGSTPAAVEITVWKEDGSGCATQAEVVADPLSTDLTFEVEANTDYFLFVENTLDTANAFEVHIIKSSA